MPAQQQRLDNGRQVGSTQCADVDERVVIRQVVHGHCSRGGQRRQGNAASLWSSMAFAVARRLAVCLGFWTAASSSSLCFADTRFFFGDTCGSQHDTGCGWAGKCLCVLNGVGSLVVRTRQPPPPLNAMR